MADINVSLYVTDKEYGANGLHAAQLVKDGLKDALQHQSITSNVTVVDKSYDVGGQDGDCDGSPWSNWKQRVNNSNILKKSESNLLITRRGRNDDINGDGCAEIGGDAAMIEGGKAFDNVNGISGVPRFSTGQNSTHFYLCGALMEIGHNFGGRHTSSIHHGADTTSPNGIECWTPIVVSYGGLKGETNDCGTDTLACYCGDKDRYYSDCMGNEFTS